MATFTRVNCGYHNTDIAYTFHFVNNSTQGTRIFYNLDATLAAQPVQYLNGATPFQVQPVSGNSSQWVEPGVTASYNFNAPGLLQSGQPPLLAIQTQSNDSPVTACCRFWSGGGSAGTLIGVVGDAIQAGVNIVVGGAEAASFEEDPLGPFSAVTSAISAAQDMAQMGATVQSDENQYLNIIVEPQSGNFGWVQETNSSSMCSATNNTLPGYNMTLIINGGGNSANTQNIYVQYSD